MKKILLSALLLLFSASLCFAGAPPTYPPPSDEAYNATTWDGITGIAPSKNAVRDKIESVVATVPTTITVADTADTTTFPMLATDAAADVAPKTDGALTYNAGTGNLGANIGTFGTISAGAAGFAVDADGDVTAKSVTITKQTGVAGSTCVYEADGSSLVCWVGPAARSSDLNLKFPDADPAADQFLLFPAPTTGTATAAWQTYGLPTAADGDALGSATLEWSDLFLADGGVIYFQNDQSVYLTPSAATLTLTGTFATTAGVTVGTSLLPDAADGATIGSATAEWSDIYLADGGVIYFQNDQSVYLTPSASTLTLTGNLVTTGTVTGPTANDPYIALQETDGTDWWIGADDTGNTLEFRTNATVGNTVIMELNEDGTGLTIGDNGDDDITLTFNANTSDGTIKWNEDEANFTTSPTRVTPPAAQTIASGNTIAADACGGLKQITASGAVTTDTTNTFTAPAAANTGCCMDVVNVGAENITLDNNTLFKSAGGADVVLGAADSVRVCSNGSAWYQIGATGNN